MSKMLYQDTDFVSELYFIFFLANFKDRRILLSVGILDILKSTEIGEKNLFLRAWGLFQVYDLYIRVRK